ncbi:MAG: DUF2330 domain-containing protein [Planctomycetes bacterium]|nr:DUF2330 domain-containing protein [Planctomycetota bacterium]
MWRFAPVLLAGLWPLHTLADGCKFPTKAYPKLPAIPVQSALLTWRDGVETLVIRSSLDGPGEEFGWVVPVPATPTRIEQASPGLLQTLTMGLGPEIVHDRLPGTVEAISMLARLSALITGVWVLMVLRMAPGTRRQTVFSVILMERTTLYFLLCLIAGALLNPSTLSLGGGSKGLSTVSAGVAVEAEMEVGSYGMSVLRAETPQDLDAWLESGGLRTLPPEGVPVVADYIRRDWRFVAARLRRTGEGLARPHPIALSFPCDPPVYPMRLTALAHSPLDLDLFVAGERQATAPGLTTAYVDRFGQGERDSVIFTQSPDRYFTTRTVYRGQTFHYDLGHLEAMRLLWDGCVLTRLSGTFDPVSDMGEDLVLGWTETAPFRPLRWTPRGAGSAGQAAAALLWALAIPILLLARYPVGGDRVRLRLLVRAVLPALGLASVGGGLTYLALPKVAVTEGHPVQVYALSDQVGREARAMLEEETLTDAPTVHALTARLIERVSATNPHNPYTGAALAAGDGPGDIQFLETEGGLELRLHTLEGPPHSGILLEHPFYLDALDLDRMRQGWGRSMANRSVEGNPLSVAGTVFSRGIGTHAVSELAIELHGAGLEFLAMVGLGEERTRPSAGSVVFQVYVDGRSAWRSGVMRHDTPPAEVRVPLEGARSLRLMVEDGGDGIGWDHAVWGLARVVHAPGRWGRPVAVAPR